MTVQQTWIKSSGQYPGNTPTMWYNSSNMWIHGENSGNFNCSCMRTSLSYDVTKYSSLVIDFYGTCTNNASASVGIGKENQNWNYWGPDDRIAINYLENSSKSRNSMILPIIDASGEYKIYLTNISGYLSSTYAISYIYNLYLQ